MLMARSHLERSQGASLSQFRFLNRQNLYLRPDPTRVVVRPFKPATEPRDLNPTDKIRANHIVGKVVPTGNQIRRMVETSLEAVALCGASLLSDAFAPVPSPSERGFLNSSPQAEPSVQISRPGLPR